MEYKKTKEKYSYKHLILIFKCVSQKKKKKKKNFKCLTILFDIY